MSADNWRVCPKCKVLAAKDYDKRQKAIDKAYGKVSRKTFQQIVTKAKKKIDIGTTLAEYYEIDTDEYGSFAVLYNCKCHKCGFSYRFEHEESLNLE